MNPVVSILAVVIFVVGFAMIVLEHTIRINKSATAMVTGALLWILVATQLGTEDIAHHLTETGAGVFGIIIFLLCALSLVEILVHYRFFDLVRGKLYSLHFTDRKQFALIAVIAFFLSAVIDNLTTTVIMIQISRKFFKGNNLLVVAAGIVIVANAGGAFSPIGDITTIMLWFAKKFGTGEIIVKGILPSIVLGAVAVALLMRQLKPVAKDDDEEEIITQLEKSEKPVVTVVFISFLLPLFANLIGLAPYFGLLLGLGIVWITVDLMKRFSSTATHLSASIEDLIRKTDIASLKFFVGILIAVAALHAGGLLEKLAHFIYGYNPNENALIVGNVALGIISAVLDNVPLTDIAIKMAQTTDDNIWILLALAVGTGGSLLVVGSAAGVVAMGMVKELTFGRYFKIAFLPALIGFLAAVLTWYLDFKFLI